MKRLVFLFLLAFASIQGSSQQFQPATPLSGNTLTRDFINLSFEYPAEDLLRQHNGKVTYQFNINNMGDAYRFTLVSGQTKAMNAEALRLIRCIEWKPATQDGKNIASQTEYTIVFEQKKYKRQLRKRPSKYILTTQYQIDTSFIIFNLKQLEHAPQATANGEIVQLNTFIGNELKYPESAQSLGIQGTVRLGFVVESDGIASNINVEHAVGGGCDGEAIRILQMIRWIPGIKNNTIVRSRAYFEVTFKLNDRKQNEIPNRQSSGL